MTRMVFDHTKSLICMNTTTKKRSNAAKIGWLRHDLAALKRTMHQLKVGIQEDTVSQFI